MLKCFITKIIKEIIRNFEYVKESGDTSSDDLDRKTRQFQSSKDGRSKYDRSVDDRSNDSRSNDSRSDVTNKKRK